MRDSTTYDAPTSQIETPASVPHVASPAPTGDVPGSDGDGKGVKKNWDYGDWRKGKGGWVHKNDVKNTDVNNEEEKILLTPPEGGT